MTPEDANVRILARCPQCGGDLDFAEETQVVQCQYCGSSLMIAGRGGVLRYSLPPRIIDPREARSRALSRLRGADGPPRSQLEAFLVHAPFWRIQGVAFRWIFGRRPMAVPASTWGPPPMEWAKALSTRILDFTLPGFKDADLGIHTLGIRTQVLQLRPLGREERKAGALLFPLEIPLERVRTEAEQASQSFIDHGDVEPEFILRRMVGLRLSVVYTPIWCVPCRGRGGQEIALLDGVTGDLLRPRSPDGIANLSKIQEGQQEITDPFGEMRFLPFRCPDCGWRFPFRSQSLLHLCPTCHRLWGERQGDWARVPYAAIPPPQGRPWNGHLWVPFWRYRARLGSEGHWMETMADLYRLAPPPRIVKEQEQASRPIHFYVPAMRLRNPNASQTLASRFTFVQPQVTPGRFPLGFRPLNAGGSLADGDAREMGPVILGAILPPRNRRARQWLRDARVELDDPQVLFFPFERKSLFWRELWTGLSFQHSAISEDLPGERG